MDARQQEHMCTWEGGLEEEGYSPHLSMKRSWVSRTRRGRSAPTSHLPISLEDGVRPDLEQEGEPEGSAPQSKVVLTYQWRRVKGYRPIPTGQIWANGASEERVTQWAESTDGQEPTSPH